MIFLVLTAVTGIVLFAGTVYFYKKFSKDFGLPKKIFWKAGFFLLLIELFYLTVVGNATSIWPVLLTIGTLQKALLLGLVSGLFFELGKFVILDRVMKDIRSYQQGIFFGFGWQGVETLFLGVLIFLSVFGMQILVNTTDLSAVMPNAGTQEIEQLKTYQQDAKQLLAGNSFTNGNAFVAMAPLLERGAGMLVDIALSLLMILGLIKGEFKYVWLAVGVRALFVFLLVYLSEFNPILPEAVFVVFGIAAWFGIKKIKAFYPNNLKSLKA